MHLLFFLFPFYLVATVAARSSHIRPRDITTRADSSAATRYCVSDDDTHCEIRRDESRPTKPRPALRPRSSLAACDVTARTCYGVFSASMVDYQDAAVDYDGLWTVTCALDFSSYGYTPEDYPSGDNHYCVYKGPFAMLAPDESVPTLPSLNGGDSFTCPQQLPCPAQPASVTYGEAR